MHACFRLLLVTGMVFVAPAATATPIFVDITAEAGVVFVHETGAFGEKWLPEAMGSGVVIFDADGDLDLDLLFLNGTRFPGKPGRETSQVLYLNRTRDGETLDGPRFRRAGAEAGMPVGSYCLGGAAGDVDNDGDADLLLACVGQDHLLLNDGSGHFTDHSRTAGLVADYEHGAAASLFDADRDGLLDLFLTRYVTWTPEIDQPCYADAPSGEGDTPVGERVYCTPQLYQGASPRFYRNQGSGQGVASGEVTFVEQTRRAGLFAPDAKALGVALLDLDDDGWLDLAVACDTAPNLLFRNRGRGSFAEIALASGVAVSDEGVAKGGMGIDAADYDGSGRESLLVSYFAGETAGLYRNEGELFFLDVAAEAGLASETLPTLGWGTFFFDFDLDGDLDIFVANGHLGESAAARPGPPGALRAHAQPAQLFENRGGRFHPLSGHAARDLSVPRVGRGAAFGDLDGDGDPDLVISTNGGPAVVLENRTRHEGQGPAWLQVALEGEESNRQGVGARVRVQGGGTTQSRRVVTGGSYLSQSQLEPLFGLGATGNERQEVEVTWPSGKVQRVREVAPGQRLLIREAEAGRAPAADREGLGSAAEGDAAEGDAAEGDAANVTGAEEAGAERAAAEHHRGLAALAEGQTKVAIKAFTAAVAAAPPGAPATRFNFALALGKERAFDQALEVLQTLPAMPRASVLRAQLLRSAGRSSEALAAWEEARQRGELDVPSLWHLVQLRILGSDWAGALAVLDGLEARISGPAADGPDDTEPVEWALAVERAEALAGRGSFDPPRPGGSDAFVILEQAAASFAPGDAEVTELVAEARSAWKSGAGEEARTLVSITANILRSMEGYRLAIEELTRQSPTSLLSDAPLPLPLAPKARVPPPAFEASMEAIEPEALPRGARALCWTGDRLVVLGEDAARAYEPEPGSQQSPGTSAQLPGTSAGTSAKSSQQGSWKPAESLKRSLLPASTECLAAHLDGTSGPGRDLVFVGPAGTTIVWGDGTATLVDPRPTTGATLLDADLDGDTDLALWGSDAASGLHLWQNNRDRTFTDRSVELGLAAATRGGRLLAALATDVDANGEPDLYVMRQGAPNLVLSGFLHDGPVEINPTQEGAGGLSGPIAVADLDADGSMELWSEVEKNARAGAPDLDSDGLPDLVTLSATGDLLILHGRGGGEAVPWLQRTGVQDVAILDTVTLAILTMTEGVLFSRAGSFPSITLELTGTKDNPDALGARIDLYAGQLRVHREVRRSTWEIAGDESVTSLGLGGREKAEWVRVGWPNRTWSSLPELRAGRHVLEQPPDLVGSCPFLYTWDGADFSFVTDLLGGSPLGLPVARGVQMPSDPEEYVLVRAEQLRPRSTERGELYELRITEELREVLFLDHAELLVVDRPAGVVVATDDGLRLPPYPPFRLYASSSARPAVRAWDHSGRDVTELVGAIDGRYPATFRPSAFQGYAEPHTLTLEWRELEGRELPGALPPDSPFLVVTGGYYWAEADNLALSQSTRVDGRPPVLEIWRQGGWQTLLDPMPFPGGRAKTLAVPLPALSDKGSLVAEEGRLRLRIRSNLRLYFDQILLAFEDVATDQITVQHLGPDTAELRFRGYSAQLPSDGHLPPAYDYQQVSPARPYSRFEGFFTRFGDVRELLEKADDVSVILHHGDELALTFPAPPAPPPGYERDFLIATRGWDKDGDPNVAASRTVGPLPFRGMQFYPYGAAESFPWTLEKLELARRYQTRWVSGH